MARLTSTFLISYLSLFNILDFLSTRHSIEYFRAFNILAKYEILESLSELWCKFTYLSTLEYFYLSLVKLRGFGLYIS